MKTQDFDYNLDESLIAQEPSQIRDACKLLVLDKETGKIEDRIFRDIIDYLSPGDLLIANETRVLPSRLIGRKRNSGGVCEIFLLRPSGKDPHKSNHESYWEVLVKPGKRLKPGSGAIVDIIDSDENVVLSAEVVDWSTHGGKGERIARLTTPHSSFDEALHAVGQTPLPPYIKNYKGDIEMYQTVYSNRENSAAAPTAGLHFTTELIDRLRDKGIIWETVELQVGLDTFRIVEEENAEDHIMHTEIYSVSDSVESAILDCKARGNKVIAVGTTAVRALESAAELCNYPIDPLKPVDLEPTSIFIYPGYKFKIVDGLITNFHVPKSSLMMLVSALAGRENIMNAYEHAMKSNYRFLSFGDAMFIK